MKKTSLIVSTIVVVGIAYTGSTWYMGKQTQQIIENGIVEINELHNEMASVYLSQPGDLVKLSSYERGIFASKGVYIIDYQDIDGNKAQYQIETNIQHGPLPLEALLQGKLKPLMAYSSAHMVVTPEVAKWFDPSSAETPLHVNTEVHFNGNANSALNFAPLSLEPNNNHKIEFSGGQGWLNFANNFSDISGAANFDSYSVLNKNNNETASLNNIKFNSNTTANKANNSFDHLSSIAIDSIDVTTDANANNLKIIDLNLELNAKQENGFINSRLLYSFDDIELDGQNTGKINLGINLSNLEEKALNELHAAYMALIAKHKLDEYDHFKPATAEENELIAKVAALLAAKPVLRIEPLEWSNSGGTSNLTLNVAFKEFSEHANSPDEVLQESIDNAHLKININRAMLLELVSQMSKQSDFDVSNAMAEIFLEQYIEKLSRMGLATSDGESIKLDLYIDPAKDEVILNEKTMPLSQLVMIGFGLMLGM